LLPAITGNIDIPGGWIMGMHVIDDVPILLENISPEMSDKRMGADDFKVLCSRHALFPSANVLTDDSPPYDPALGTYQLRALLCKVYK